MELVKSANAVLVLGEDLLDARRFQAFLFVLAKASCGLSEVAKDGFGGMHRREWSRLETRAKEHSVKASLKVFLNLVASESEW